ncbi:MAG: hypothetical protein CMQ30_08370 [Gammaproteobacteria bacterium]|nr:hypothetical protein [Gammaproteobacteria bacterium]
MVRHFRLLYLHGFLSSPLSGKAGKNMDYFWSLDFMDSIEIPKIPTGPADAVRYLQLIIRNRKFTSNRKLSWGLLCNKSVSNFGCADCSG